MKTLIIILTLSVTLFCQSEMNKKNIDEDPMLYFPYHKGDIFQFYEMEFGHILDTVQWEVKIDSFDTEGNKIIGIWWNSIGWNDGMMHYYKIDSSFNVWQDNFLRYKLNANQGAQWVAHTYGDSGEYGYEIMRVVEEFEESILGVPTKSKDFLNFWTMDSIDTLGLVRYGERLSYGFGMTSRSDGFVMLSLRGCIINGTKYGIVTSVKDLSEKKPNDFDLYQNYPNPFNPNTTIRYKLNTRQSVSLTLYDILGKEILKLINNENYPSGDYKTVWNGKNSIGEMVPSGIYFYRLAGEEFSITRSMILLK